MKRKPLLAYWLPEICFVGVLCVHLFLVHGFSLAPWRGGGFAMYSTIDSNHSVRAFFAEGVTNQGLNCALDLSEINQVYEYDQFVIPKLKQFPLKSKLRELANHLLVQDYVWSPSNNKEAAGKAICRPVQNLKGQEIVTLKKLKLVIARRSFQVKTGRLHWKPLFEAIEVTK